MRLVYNLALEQRRDFWRQYRRVTGRPIDFPGQSRELTALRAEFDWIAAVNRTTQEQALRDLDQAFANFFAGRARHPTPRRKGVEDAARFKADECGFRALNARWGMIRLPGVGWVKYRSTRPITGEPRNVTIRHEAGCWAVSVATRREHVAPEHSGPAVGVDRGVTTSLALSTGEMMRLPAGAAAMAQKVARAQRVLSRRHRGSKRYARQRLRVNRLQARAARIRRDFHHRAALDLARRFSPVALEALNVVSMTSSARGTRDAPGRNVRQKAGLNRVILNQGWRAFETILAYKLEERGGRLVKVPAAYSSQTCSACGVVDRESRKSQARFSCVHCGHEAHADTNAAVEILRRHTASMDVEGVHFAPFEASTGEPVAA